ncbi:type IV toxin-antitoxin system AbiEi family antitoxin domain-containing protein [Corynebacterium phocae]|uniref:type IV toxin-antitoxin system AbiEi family antitoxin domain-containing protein n=1 Tax=Corynebacterium phocae TaxID=161895 RepID=UPI000952E5C8|nr:type IV toxin-antitoxin system AbiEi family antitoxin domain-containing protein [Corynebacterium phocae]KAA8720834.1 hypothetical protein F4V58_11370 [Corynebacterium phocae]
MLSRDLIELASAQYGVFTTAQAAQYGVSRASISRAARRGELRTLRRGVYAFEASFPVLYEDVYAAWLSLDPARTFAERLQNPTEFVVCSTTAAWLYEIGVFEPYGYQFFATRRKQTNSPEIRLRIRELPAEDVQQVRGLPVTTPTRTILDLLGEGYDLDHMGRLVTDAVGKNLPIDWPRLVHELPRHAEFYGLTAMDLLRELTTFADTPVEQAQVVLSMSASLIEVDHQIKTYLSDLLPSVMEQLVAASPLPDSTTDGVPLGRLLAQGQALTYVNHEGTQHALEETSQEEVCK